jgi:hypothetical protein
MISRDSRTRLAEALRHYTSGQISNDDLDDVEVDWRDRGAVAIQGMAWSLYDDTKYHYVEKRLPRGSSAREIVARWILFLHTDMEYMWPEYSFYQIRMCPDNFVMNFLTFGLWRKESLRRKKRWEQYLEAGEFDVWPFLHQSEYQHSLSNPRLLNAQQ